MAAFYAGDVELAFIAAKELTDAYHEALVEASRLRFKVNFGTERCTNCTGLRAGPGVAATCYQVKRCDYSHIREGKHDGIKERVLLNLLRDK